MLGGLLLEEAGLAQGQETGAWLTARSGIAGQDCYSPALPLSQYDVVLAQW